MYLFPQLSRHEVDILPNITWASKLLKINELLVPIPEVKVLIVSQRRHHFKQFLLHLRSDWIEPHMIIFNSLDMVRHALQPLGSKPTIWVWLSYTYTRTYLIFICYRYLSSSVDVDPFFSLYWHYHSFFYNCTRLRVSLVLVLLRISYLILQIMIWFLFLKCIIYFIYFSENKYSVLISVFNYICKINKTVRIKLK